jgi:pimeloyl-ACP methyl ester carboxylesterase
MPSIESGGLRIHYDDIGRGEPLLLLHGGMASAEFWNRAGYVDALRDSHRLVIPDLRGHGRGSRPRDEAAYALRYDIADMVAVLDAAGVSRVSVCGWSWGGTVALGLAATHPERVTAVLATGTSPRRGFSDVPADFGHVEPSAASLETYGMSRMAEDMERQGGARWLHELTSDNDPLALAAWFRGRAAAEPAGCALGDITRPVLFVAGEHEVGRLGFTDPLLPTHAGLHVIPGENHVSAFLRVDVLVPALAGLLAGGRAPA